MVNTTENLRCRPVPVWHIRLPYFAAAIKCRDLVSGIGYSTVPYFGPLGQFCYSSLTPSNRYKSYSRYAENVKTSEMIDAEQSYYKGKIMASI